MDSKAFATHVTSLIERANVPASAGNIQILMEIYQILGQMQQGAIILAQAPAPAPVEG